MAERPEDLNLPNAVITRIIKDAIPEGVNVSKEARLAISKAASVFVLYATSCSNNFAMKGKRKTINAQDVMAAMEDMEFDEFIDPLQKCLDTFRKDQQDKKEASEQRRKAHVVEEPVETIDVNGDDGVEEQEQEQEEQIEEQNEENSSGDVEEIEEEEEEEEEVEEIIDSGSAYSESAEVIELSDSEDG